MCEARSRALISATSLNASESRRARHKVSDRRRDNIRGVHRTMRLIWTSRAILYGEASVGDYRNSTSVSAGIVSELAAQRILGKIAWFKAVSYYTAFRVNSGPCVTV